jgi:hypothetical protein
MKKIFLLTIFTSFLLISCEDSKKEKNPAKLESDSDLVKKNESEIKISKETITDATNYDEIAEFIPKGFKAIEKIKGDLNKDGIDDCIIFIKAINKKNIMIDEHRGELDRNRRGIIVLLNENGKYKPFLKNTACFSSENEEGGAYFPPELSLDINNGKLYVEYGHGRYGYWSFTFRLKNSDFELIGYDSSNNNGAIINFETSINFLTNKKIEKTNTNENADSGEEVFEENKVNLKAKPLLKLSEMKDFDGLNIDFETN